jgi:RNA-directed DNA polymerase
LLANIYQNWFDKAFHCSKGPAEWSDARLIRYADDFVIMARYQAARIDEWLRLRLETCLGLSINREKTSVVKLEQGEMLDFLGFTFRYDRELYGGMHRYLNVFLSKKSLLKVSEAIRAKTDPSKCFKPTSAVVRDLNTYLKGWCGYFNYGYPSKQFSALNYYVGARIHRDLNRRSQRKYHCPKGMSTYQYLQKLGLLRI